MEVSKIIKLKVSSINNTEIKSLLDEVNYNVSSASFDNKALIIGKITETGISSPINLFDWHVQVKDHTLKEDIGKYCLLVGDLSKENGNISINPSMEIITLRNKYARNRCIKETDTSRPKITLSNQYCVFNKEFQVCANFKENEFNKLVLVDSNNVTFSAIVSKISAKRFRIGEKYRLCGTLISTTLFKRSETDLVVIAELKEGEEFINSSIFKTFLYKNELYRLIDKEAYQCRNL